MNSISQNKISKKVITSQRQTVIKLIEKKDKDKRFIKNRRHISLLDVDYKIISKIFSDLLEVTKKFKTKGYLVTIHIEKTFDSLDHSFLLTTLEKFGFGTNFIDWIKIFLTRIVCNKWRCHNIIW